MKNYYELKNQQPEFFECFFAFSNEQFEEGVKKMGLEGKKLYDGNHGLYGTKEGLRKLDADYDAISKQIADECDPQDAYNYEFGNHECEYVCGDTEAIKLVVAYFGEERARTVKRRYGYIDIDDLFKREYHE